MRPATGRTVQSTQRGLATEMVATSGVRTWPSPIASLYWNTSRPTDIGRCSASDLGRDPERLGKSAVEFWVAYRAQTLQLQQRLEYLWDLNPTDVSAVAGMQPSGKVQVMMVGPIGPAFLRHVELTWVEHGRPGQREDRRALAYQRLMRRAGSEAVVFLGHTDDHRIDRAEAECLEDQVGERIVVVGCGGGSGAGQRIGSGEQHQQRPDCRLGGRLPHAYDKPHQGSANAVIVEACGIARTLQAQ